MSNFKFMAGNTVQAEVKICLEDVCVHAYRQAYDRRDLGDQSRYLAKLDEIGEAVVGAFELTKQENI